MVSIEEIQQAFVDELERITANEKQRKANPDPDDIMESLVPPKDVDVDYDYLKEIVADLFKSDVFVYPKNQADMEECVKDLVFALIFQPNNYESQIILQKAQSPKTPLEKLHQKIVKGEKIPLPTYTLNFNLQDLTFHNIPLEKIAKSGNYYSKDNFIKNFYYGSEDKFQEQLSNAGKWVKGKFNLNITIPFLNCDLNNLQNDITFLVHALKTEIAWRYDLGDVVVSFGQKNIENYDTRYLHTEHTLGHMKELNDIVKSLGGELYFSELGETSKTKWTINQLIVANNQIDELANTIKKNKFSPFEAVLYICAWSSINLAYNYNSEDSELNNTIIAAAVTKKIQCVGFAEFVNAVLNTVNFANLDIKEYPDSGILDAIKISCTTAKSEEGYVPDHCESQIYIEDKKYGLMGNYICDVNLTQPYEQFLKPIETQLAAVNLPSILPFNALYLRNLTEIKTMLPDYKIFPYTKSNINKVFYSQEKISKADMISHKMKNQVESINGVKYSDYMKKSDEIMDMFEQTQGSPIPEQNFIKAYKKVLPVLYPDLKKDDLAKMEKLISKINTSLNSILLDNPSTKEFSLNTPTK